MDAEDITHEAFLRAAQYRGLDLRRMAPFLVTVVKRLCVDDHRRRLGARQVAEHPRLLPPQGADPAEVAGDRDEARWALTRCGRLTERECFVLLRLAQGVPHEEISRLLGTTRRATECIASRARVRIRRTLARHLAASARGGRHVRRSS